MSTDDYALDESVIYRAIGPPALALVLKIADPRIRETAHDSSARPWRFKQKSGEETFRAFNGRESEVPRWTSWQSRVSRL